MSLHLQSDIAISRRGLVRRRDFLKVVTAGAAAGGSLGIVVAQIALYLRCSKMTGLRCSAIQDWRGLSRIVFACGFAALASYGVLWFELSEILFFRIFLAGLVFVACYLLGLKLFGSSNTVRTVLGPRFAILAGF